MSPYHVPLRSWEDWVRMRVGSQLASSNFFFSPLLMTINLGLDWNERTFRHTVAVILPECLVWIRSKGERRSFKPNFLISVQFFFFGGGRSQQVHLFWMTFKRSTSKVNKIRSVSRDKYFLRLVKMKFILFAHSWI